MIYRVTTTSTTVIAESESERLIFPFHWRGFERAYTYASIDRATPTRNGERMDLATFTRWMALLESLSSADGATMEIEV